MPMPPMDIANKVFGQLTAVCEVLPRSKPRRWLCKCTCGNLSEVIQGNLTSGVTNSCGCLRITTAKEKNTTHGGRKDPLYRVWSGMLTRCNNPNTESYPYYGGRGISVCVDWQEYPAFKNWAVTAGYEKGLSIDRIDTNGNYSPTNCRWATAETQNRNRNKQKNTSSKYLGVSWNSDSGKWIAAVKPAGKRVFLGYFENETCAAKSRDTYIIENKLEDFVLNFN